MRQMDLFSVNTHSSGIAVKKAVEVPDGTTGPAEAATDRRGTPGAHRAALDILVLRAQAIVFTTQQAAALREIAGFLMESNECRYILAGYAGTGKTTIAENIINYAIAVEKECIITAPTNQAVKVLKDKFGTAKAAFKTLHSTLYGSPDVDTGEWIPSVALKAWHVVIVDEASMINKTVYTDLIHAVQAANAKVIFLGDSFQLEPVGDDPAILQHKNFELTEVKRQGVDSEILLYATCLRSLGHTVIPDQSRGAVSILGKQAAAKAFLQSVRQSEDSIFIVGTNKARIALNKRARQEKFGGCVSDEPRNADKVLFIGNSTCFINGDKITLDQICVLSSVKLPVRQDAKELAVHLDAYLLVQGSHKIVFLPAVEKASVYHGQFIQPDKYFPADWCDKGVYFRGYELSANVSIATYGYAVTAHKSQGGQWEKVYIHQDAFRNNPRWLYTAVTRAEKEVTLTSESSACKRTWEQIGKIVQRS